MIEKDRVAARISALGVSPITLAKKVGLERGFINDILVGRKKSVMADRLELVAQALECSTDYLLGKTDDPRPMFLNRTVPMIPVRGLCEAGAWRKVPATIADITVPHDTRLTDIPQWAYMVGGSVDHPMVATGMIVIVSDPAVYRTRVRQISKGMIVVATRERDNGEVETALWRVVEGGRIPRLASIDRNVPEAIDLKDGDDLKVAIVGIATLCVGDISA